MASTYLTRTTGTPTDSKKYTFAAWIKRCDIGAGNSKIFSRTGAYQGIGFAIPSNLVVQIATQLIRFGELQSLWIGNFRVTKIRINKGGYISSGLRIIEMQNSGPLFEKGVRINDVILSINDETASWSNLTSSLKFATLGENLSMEILNENNEIISIDF